MKKFVKVLSVVLICIMCVVCVSGCNQEQIVTTEDMVQALKDNGFTDAYSYNEEISTVTGKQTSTLIYIDKDDTCYIVFSGNSKCRLSIYDISENTDIEKILTSIIPLFDPEFTSSDAAQIIETDEDGSEAESINEIMYYYYEAHNKYSPDDEFAELITVDLR